MFQFCSLTIRGTNVNIRLTEQKGGCHVIAANESRFAALLDFVLSTALDLPIVRCRQDPMFISRFVRRSVARSCLVKFSGFPSCRSLPELAGHVRPRPDLTVARHASPHACAAVFFYVVICQNPCRAFIWGETGKGLAYGQGSVTSWAAAWRGSEGQAPLSSASAGREYGRGRLVIHEMRPDVGTFAHQTPAPSAEKWSVPIPSARMID